ncbi:MAG: hypothetical protein AABY93_16200 [Bacteroidota bacterium]
MFSRIFLTSTSLFLSSLVFAQEVNVNGRFTADSVKIGEPVQYTLTARYPKNLTIIFPDSTFAFEPFEFQKKRFFTTQTTDGQSYDSVVYSLSTYEIDSVQRLSIPVFIVHRKDCTAILPNDDEIVLKQLVRHIPDSVAAKDLPLKTNTNYLNVHRLFNYPIALIVSGILIVLSIACFLIFGKRVRKYFLLRKLNRNHRDFIAKFNEIVSQLQSDFSAKRAEAALVLWKYYMESLLQTPYPKLTSKEIIEFEKDGQLGDALHSIDRVIYGGVVSSAVQSFDSLRTYCDHEFQLKFEKTKNG